MAVGKPSISTTDDGQSVQTIVRLVVKSIYQIPVYFVATLLFRGHDTDIVATCERHSVERETKNRRDENDRSRICKLD
jgi:hypothetical protein